VLFYQTYRLENLISPRLSGVRMSGALPDSPMRVASWRRALVGVALAALATWTLARGFWT
jgi:hypothetical protein